MANSSRGVMKIDTEGADSAAAITSRVPDTKGLPYKTIEGLEGVVQLDKLDEAARPGPPRTSSGELNLETVDLP